MAEQRPKSQAMNVDSSESDESWKGKIERAISLHTHQLAMMQSNLKLKLERSDKQPSDDRRMNWEAFKYFSALLKERKRHRKTLGALRKCERQMRRVIAERDALQVKLDDEEERLAMYDPSD